MFKLLFAFITCLICAPSYAQEGINWNREWEFQLGDVGQNAPNGWQLAHIPHNFSQPYFLGEDFYVGEGWYRKNLKVPANLDKKKVFLDFEGVFQVADVYVDDQKVGSHEGGYTGFRVDLTPALKAGQKQRISVRVSNRWNPQIAPRAGEHVFTGGIYRDVRLVMTDDVYIAPEGIWVRTPAVSNQKASVEVETELVNAGKTPRSITVTQKVIGPNGKPLNVGTTKILEIPAGEMLTYKTSLKDIVNPKLWSPAQPNLYTLETQVHERETLLSKQQTSFGLRWFKFTPDKGFFLNGKPLFLMGANVHQDSAGWGDAVTNGSHFRDVRLMKEAGFNFIRGSHYPHDPTFTKACDQLGMIFWSEGIVWGMGGQKAESLYWNDNAVPATESDRPGFQASVNQTIREMIRTNRNSPSVVTWSVCNEPFFVDNQLLDPSRQIIKDAVAAAREADPDRPISVGGVQRAEFDKLGDIAGYNGDGARIYQNPGMPNIVAEYGSTVTKRPGKFEPGFGEFENKRPEWRAGAAIWCGFDHGSIWSAGSRMGIVDYFRLPKRSWYWYREDQLKIAPPAWPEPGTPFQLALSADKKEITSCEGEDDALIIVRVLDKSGKHISNTPPVTLSIEAGPGEFPTGKSITFNPDSDIEIIEGMAAISMRSYYSGKTLIRASSPGLKDATLVLQTAGNRPYDKATAKEMVDRPYKKFTKEDRIAQEQAQGKEKKAEVKANLAANRPCRASSNDDKARLASDGDPKTSWAPADNDEKPAWILDMEFDFPIAQLIMTMKDGQSPAISLETSQDKNTWLPLNIANIQKTPEGNYAVNVGMQGKARFLRINFNDAKNATIQEVAVYQ